MRDSSTKNIMLTGGTSFIGLNLLKKLIEKNNNIFVIVRPGSCKIPIIPKSDKINIIELDMSEYCYLSDYIYERCDIFYSFAWDGTRGNLRDNKELQLTNYKASMSALKFAIESGCKKFISAGSQAEYGVHNVEVSEGTMCSPITEYGKFKLKFYQDGYKLCMKNNIRFIEPRFFSIYGPGDYEESMINIIIKLMLQDKECNLTECTQMWNYLYIEDAIEAILKLSELDCKEGVYNIGSSSTRSLKEFVKLIYKLINSKSKLNFGAIHYPISGAISIMPDITKIKNETGWRQKVCFEEGITLTIEHLKQK